MGNRSNQTTKSGRFMNPADQQRKADRAKELKRNKKQRLSFIFFIIFSLVIGKNCWQIEVEKK